MQYAGYQWLVSEMGLNVIPHYSQSFVSDKNLHKTILHENGLIEEHYPKNKRLENTVCGHLEFALKNEGLNLEILKACFQKIDPQELTAHIQKKPTGRFARILWFLFEALTEEMLDLPNLKQGNYVDLLDSKKYYTSSPEQIARQRVNMNLPGTPMFSPLIRRTKKNEAYELKKLDEKCSQILSEYPPELVARAVNQLYLGETRASNQIENEEESPSKDRRFKALLEKAGTEEYLNKEGLLALHRQVIVDPRFQTDGWRTTQEYVGTATLYTDAEVHFIPPRPQELGSLMENFEVCAQRMMSSDMHPVAKAAALSFLFVYLHPFKDGNGRMHRFLIHHVLSKTEFAPHGQIFPVSQVMRDDMKKYQQVLNWFSTPLMEQVDYQQDSSGEMTVLHDTSDYYRYIDLTGVTEFLFESIEKTLDRDLIQELNFLQSYDQAQKNLTAIVDGLPGKDVDRFIKFCRQNGFRLAAKKREKFFSMLTDKEIAQMEAAVQNAFEE